MSEPAVLTRAQTRQRLATTVVKPEPLTAYRWAAAAPGHPQSYVRYKLEGWEVVPAADAEKLGMSHFIDPVTGAEGGANSSNCIFNGDSILMRTTADNFARIASEKAGQFAGLDGAVEAEAEEKIEEVQEAYKRRKRGG
jgi:hypothetical protein